MNENAKTKLVLEYTGMDDFSCPVYKDQFGKLWKDIDLGKEPEPNLYSLSFNHIDGEPSHPIQQEFTFHPAPYQELWKELPADGKPEWLTWEQLLQYEKVMTETGIPVKNCSD